MSPGSSVARGWPKGWHVLVAAVGAALSSLATQPATWGESVPIAPAEDPTRGLLVTVEASHVVSVTGMWRGQTVSFAREDGGTEWTGSATYYVPPGVSDATASIGGSCGGCCGPCPDDSVTPSINVTATEPVEHWELEAFSDDIETVVDLVDGARYTGVVEASSRPLLRLDITAQFSDVGGGVSAATPQADSATHWDFTVGWYTSVHTAPGAGATWSVSATIMGHCPAGTDCEPPEGAFVGRIVIAPAPAR